MIRLRYLFALTIKESRQMLRDPSTFLIAAVLPLILMLLIAFAVSLDIRRLPIGVVLETDSPDARSLAEAYRAAPSLAVEIGRDRRQMIQRLTQGHLRGYVVIPAEFDRRQTSGAGGQVQIITDGAQPNTANFVANYARGVLDNWQAGQVGASAPALTLIPRFWFNAELESRRALVPGAIAIVMTMIGTLLTALVVAREWERGTMEALLSTPVRIGEVLLGKLVPYFLLGLLATALCTVLAVWGLGVPLRGSLLALLLISAVFLLPALGQGLLISVLAKNQFVAAQLALLSGFLPAFLLSGFLFEIDAMPWPVRLITHIVAARFYVSSLQTVFLAGDIWPLFARDCLAMLAIGAGFFLIARLKTRKSLEG